MNDRDDLDLESSDLTRRDSIEQALANERDALAKILGASAAALGAGIAHEINNPLAQVQMSLELCLEALALGGADLASLQSYLHDALDGTRRIAAIVHARTTSEENLGLAVRAASDLLEQSSTGSVDGRVSSIVTTTGFRPNVLVIDDEETLTDVLHRILTIDCEVVSVNHGREAIAVLGDESLPIFDLVLCDLTMPGVSGEQVYAEATKKRPALSGRFVFMTGGTLSARSRRFLDETGATVLQKPFDVAEVRELVLSSTDRARIG